MINFIAPKPLAYIMKLLFRFHSLPLFILAPCLLAVSVKATTGVTGFDDNGWNSDDTRNSSGTNIINGTTNAPATGATSDPAQVSNQLDWTNFGGSLGNLGGIQFNTNEPTGAQKSTLSIIDTGTGFAASSILGDPSFSATYRWQNNDTVVAGPAMKFGIQSTEFGTSAGESQNGFSASRSGEATWDLILVFDPTNNGQNSDVDGEFFTSSVDENSSFFLFPQAGSGYWGSQYGANGSTLGIGAGSRTIDEWAALDVDGNAGGETWGDLLFGAGATISNVQLGMGSGNQNGLTTVDYVEVSFVNSGAKINFVDAARYTAGNSNYSDSANWIDADGAATSASGTQNYIVDAAGTTDLTVSSSATSRSLGILNGTTNLTLDSGQTLTLSSAENGTLFIEAGATGNVSGAGTLDAGVLDTAGTLNVATTTNLSGGDDPHPQRDGSGTSRYAIVVQSGGEMTLENGTAVTVSQMDRNVGVRVGGDGDAADGVATMAIESGATLDIDSTRVNPLDPNGFFTVGAWGREAVVNQTGGTVNLTQTPGHIGSFNVGNQGGTGTYNLSGGTLNLGGGNHSLGRVASGSITTPGSGTINLSGTGTLNLNDDGFLVVGDRDAASVDGDGFVNQTGGTFRVENTADLYLGGYGNSEYNLDGGRLEIGGSSLNGLFGGAANTTGSYEFNLGGGTIQVIDSDLVTDVDVNLVSATNSTFDTNGFNAVFQNGLSGTGSFTKVNTGDLELGGTTTLSGTSTNAGDGNIIIGSASAGTGTLNLNTGAALNVDDSTGSGFSRIIVGDGETGTMNIDGGSVDLKYYNGNGTTFRVGASGGTGTVNMTDGLVTVTEGSAGSYGVIVIGQDAGSTGIFNQSGGTINQAGVANLQVGVFGGAGTFTMSDDSVFIMGGSGSSTYFGAAAANSDATVNFQDNATFTQTADVQNFIAQADSTAVFNQTGADTSVTWEGDTGSGDRPFWVGTGANGVGTYNLSAGSLAFDDINLRLGSAVDGTGIINQTGGTLTTPGSSASIGYEGTGEFNISDGSASFSEGMGIASRAGSTGTVDQTGGTVTIGTGSKVTFGAGTGTYNLDGGTLEVGGTDGIQSGSGSSDLNLRGARCGCSIPI